MTALRRPWLKRATPADVAAFRRDLARVVAALDQLLQPGECRMALPLYDRLLRLARTLEAAFAELDE